LEFGATHRISTQEWDVCASKKKVDRIRRSSEFSKGWNMPAQGSLKRKINRGEANCPPCAGTGYPQAQSSPLKLMKALAGSGVMTKAADAGAGLENADPHLRD
jgi:hypothetical protein